MQWRGERVYASKNRKMSKLRDCHAQVQNSGCAVPPQQGAWKTFTADYTAEIRNCRAALFLFQLRTGAILRNGEDQRDARKCGPSISISPPGNSKGLEIAVEGREPACSNAGPAAVARRAFHRDFVLCFVSGWTAPDDLYLALIRERLKQP